MPSERAVLLCLKRRFNMAKSPISWVGGKYRLAKTLIPMFPEHTTYVEVFGGAAHIMCRKEPSSVDIYNDIDGRLVNFFRVLQNDKQCNALCERLRVTPYSREEFERAKVEINSTDDVTRAWAFAVPNKQSFGSRMEAWGVDVTTSEQTGKFSNLPVAIQKAVACLKQVQIENSSFEYILKRYDRPGTFFYLDPPYPFTGERSHAKAYANEMTDEDHNRLADMLLHIKGKAMLSGYDTPLYAPLEDAGWRKLSVGSSAMAIKRTAGKERMRKDEFVWVNYEASVTGRQ